MRKGCLKLFCLALCLALVLGGSMSSATADLFAGEFLENSEFKNDYPIECFGFSVPHPGNYSMWNLIYPTETKSVYQKSDEQHKIQYATDYMTVGNGLFGYVADDPAFQTVLLAGLVKGNKDNTNYTDVQTEFVESDGHPVVLQTFNIPGQNYVGLIYYTRNSMCLWIQILSVYHPVTMDDLKVVAGMLGYDESNAPYTVADAELTLSVQGNPETVTAGKSVQFSSKFANTRKVNNNNKNNGVTWTVRDAETGEEVEGITITDKGRLNVDKNLAAPVDLQVKVQGVAAYTSATYNITARPVINKINVEPAELFFYLGTDAQTLKATLDPETVPPAGLIWAAGSQKLLEITEVEPGTVSVNALGAGQTKVTVKEPSGKNAAVKVNIVVPVESVELKVNGNPKAGGNVNIGAALSPRNVGNKALEWSVDVGEDIATISEKGQLRIGKEVPSGTKITVTCTALGAPTPVTASVVVEVP